MEWLSDPVFLSRLQLAITLGFHILFPTLTIGLSLFLVFLQWRWLRTHDHIYMQLFRFWTRIFALGFGVGVVSGIVLSFEFGTNFSEFSRRTGNVLAPLLSYEVLMAFFLEASFLPILLFGWGKVGPRMHFFATAMVALGTVVSAFWILAANSWMQTPAGFAIEGDRFSVVSWWEAIFNPSFPYRLAHMLTASLLTTTFVVAGVSAWFLLHDRCRPQARRALSAALWAALVLAPGQVLVGDLHGLNTLKMQPMKVAAIEGLWHTSDSAPFVVFAIPDQEAEENHFEVAIPGAGSLILQHEIRGRVLGLNEVPPEDRPPVAPVFFAFRIMIYIGFFLVAVAILGAVLRHRGVLYDRPWFLRLLLFCSPLGFVAVLSGWVVTEVGRQPWVVQGLLRTVESASTLALGSVRGSLLLFNAVYLFLLVAFLYFLMRLIRKGPEERVPPELVAGAAAHRLVPATEGETRLDSIQQDEQDFSGYRKQAICCGL